MNSQNKIFKNKSRDFLDRVIYPKQFKQDPYKTIYHIINVCSPLLEQRYILNVVKLYVPNYDQGSLELALENYIQNNKTLFRYQCFTHVEDLLIDQDLFTFRSNKKRYVTIKEFTFLLQRITKNLYESKNCESVMVNKMFLKMKTEYFKNTGRKLNEHKLTHILLVLQKHKYLHVTYNTKKQRVVQFGPSNPYYQLRKVPDIETSELQDVQTKTERELDELKNKLEIYERVREEDLATICSLQKERDKTIAKLDKTNSINQSLQKMHQEDLVELEKLRTLMQVDSVCSN